MKLKELLTSIGYKAASLPEIEVTGIAYDSREVKPGDLFVAIPGLKQDGTKFVQDAIKKGARAVVVEKEIKVDPGIAKFRVPNSRASLSLLANKFYDYPSQKLKLIGITGTNGKTTITYLVEALFKAARQKVGLIGTVEARVDGKIISLKLTTPESADLQPILAQMVQKGASYAVMEVSSHALALDRVLGCEFDTAIYTNLTHDHLDFHKTMEDYLKAKLKLFKMLAGEGKSIINVDDAYSSKVLENAQGQIIKYGIENEAEVKAQNIEIKLNLMTFDLITPPGETKISTPLIGKVNVYNILAAVACGLAYGLELNLIKKAIEGLKFIPGRFERIICGQKFPVIVDFAHSPDSLQKLVETVMPLTAGKIILVFGCPGDRDKEKRGVMGEIAGRLADFSIITTDDPHSEDPEKIIKDIEKGLTRYQKIVDRREAIKRAIEMASDEDLVLIAGRGHEKYQDFAGKKVELDYRKVAREILYGRMLGKA